MRSNDDTLKPIILPSRRSPSPLRSPPLIPPSSPKKLILSLAKKCNLNFVLNPPSPRSPSQIRQRLEEGGGGKRKEGGGKREEERGKLEELRREEGRKEESRREEARREDARREERGDVRREVREEGGGRKRGEIREESIGREGRHDSRSREGRDILSRKRSADAPRNNPNLQKLLQNLMESGNSGRYAVNNNPTTQILKSRENSIERNSQRSGLGGVGINTRYGGADHSDIMGMTTKNWNEISGLSDNLNVRNISDNNTNLLKNEPSQNEKKNEWKNEGIKGGRNDPKNEYKSEINHKNEYKSEHKSKNDCKIGETLKNDHRGDVGGINKSSFRLLNSKNDNISIKKLLNLGRLLDRNEDILTEKKKVQNKEEDVRSTVKENFNEFSLNVNINIENTLIKAATPVATPRNDKASLFKREEGRREEERREEGRKKEGRREEENRRREEDIKREESRREESRREESRREENRREEEGERRREEEGRRREEEGGRRKEEEGRREEEVKTIRGGIIENKMKGMMKEQSKKEVMTRTGKDFFAGEEKKKDIEINDRLCKEKINTVIFFN